MNQQLDERLDRVFLALANPTRRAILSQLSRQGATVGELSNPHRLSPAAMTKHLKVLESAGLVKRGKVAQFRPCQLDPDPLSLALEWISDREEFWNKNFDRLGDLVQSEDWTKQAPR